MKKITIAICVGILITACSTTVENYVLKATVGGDLKDSTRVYLKTTDSLNQIVDIDTVQTFDGAFQFEGTREIPQLHYVFVDGLRGNIPVIVENGNIAIRFHKDSLDLAEIKGTPQNDLFMGFLEESRSMRTMVTDMQQELRQANMARDTAAMTALRDEYFELQEKAKDYNIDFAKENPGALISALILENLLRTKALPTQSLDSIYQNLTPEIKATLPAKNVQSLLEKTKNTEVGNVAPDFSGPSPDGGTLALSEVKGKLTLIDFWAAWCRPCRMENPNIVSVYEQYKDKGFDIIGISLDTKANDWKTAIEKDSLDWNHISHLQRFQGPIAELYSVNAIPASFLLDENGVIVAKNLRGPALGQKVGELLQ